MAQKAREEFGGRAVEVVADKGCFSGEEIAACETAGIPDYVPKPNTSNARAEGRFEKRDFIYDRARDRYTCPAGKHLTFRFEREEAGLLIRIYWTNVCETCPLKRDCTTSNIRRVRSWENEAILECVQDRLDRHPDIMQVRRETVEHPFGTAPAKAECSEAVVFLLR